MLTTSREYFMPKTDIGSMAYYKGKLVTVEQYAMGVKLIDDNGWFIYLADPVTDLTPLPTFQENEEVFFIFDGHVRKGYIKHEEHDDLYSIRTHDPHEDICLQTYRLFKSREDLFAKLNKDLV